MVDIDLAELKKPTIHVELPIHADAKDFFEQINLELKDKKTPVFEKNEWISICQNWKKEYPVVLKRHWEENDGFANAYAAFDYISRQLPENSLTVTSNGTCCVAGHQSWYIKPGSRFFE